MNIAGVNAGAVQQAAAAKAPATAPVDSDGDHDGGAEAAEAGRSAMASLGIGKNVDVSA